ncbi:MAG TPA: protein kinase, partial [Chloroflexia bacterium]|nr:protein kinase [Chloroflexia bacterium]
MPNTPVRTIVPAIDEAAALARLTGRQVRGYQLGNLLGHGGFGAVYQSTQPMLGREVAIKIIHPRHANHPQFIRQFESEAQLIARLEHPHIVPLYDYWRDPSGAYLVMRYLRGGSLHDALQGGPWPLPACVRLLEQIGPALATAHHQGIVHRDVKPANILLDPEGNAYLADFGIAQAGGGFVRHTGGDRLPMYAAPEQIRGEAVSPQTDIYCLGLVLYQALAGAPAFVGPTPDAVAEGHLYSPLPAITTPRPELPAELALVLDQATAKDPADRYSDIEGLIADLRRAAGAGLLAPDEILRLPTGMVAFLFTDIENSTQRWEQDPTAMQAALTHHDSLLRQAFASTGGRPFQSTGDSFAVAFATAEAALACAVQAQQLLAGTVWPAPLGTLRVRMAIGVGAAAIRDGGYHAEYTLNRLARLMATGHGGQILLSGDAVAALGAPAAGALPAGAALRELGTWRLRDISDPVAVWQLVVPGLPAEFPPLRTTGATAPEPLAPPSNPYKGLRAFQEADAADLFGREALVARLVARLAAPDPLRRFLAVVGPSGSGKSSAVRAGLVPALRRGAVPDLPAPFVTDLTPGPAPLEQIEQALLRVAVRQPRDLRALLQAGPDGLIRAVAAILPDDGGTELVLVLDQFEEVFTLGDDEAARVGLLDMLRAAALAPGSRLRVILTLRADFYDRPLLYPQLGDLLRERTEVVVPLTRAELQAAISGPAARVGVEVEPALLATLMQEVSEQPGMLPLLQYTLTELFAERTGRRLTLAAYVAAGGVLGSLGLRADAIYAALDPAAQVVARQVFLRLVTLGEGAEDTRRRARQTELAALAPDPGALAAVLDAFGQHWLLTFDRDPRTREPTVEVAHEALIRTWGQMRAWLDAGRADLRVQRQLHTAAHEWQDGGQDASFLARGARLGQFAALADSREVALTAEERTFLTASLAARAADAAAEEARRGQELALARSAARRLRSLVAVLAVFLIVAGALAAFAAS